MAIYEYWCEHCQKKFEEYHPISKADSSNFAYCPVCHSISRRIISHTNINMQNWKEKMNREIEYARTPVPDAKIVND